MKKILLVSTGGTFNKQYNPHDGTLVIDGNANALRDIGTKWLCDFEIITTIGKDSLDMSDEDRAILLELLRTSVYDDIIVIHGTDTMDQSAELVAQAHLGKRIVFTGAMVPYAIDPVEATANLTASFGYLQALKESGVYISMNGIIDSYDSVAKDRRVGKFVTKEMR